jgi:hypothetical protein
MNNNIVTLYKYILCFKRKINQTNNLITIKTNGFNYEFRIYYSIVQETGKIIYKGSVRKKLW